MHSTIFTEMTSWLPH